MDNMDKIIERVQKLLNLAGNNPNENEAAAAVEKAHAILAAHNLDMAHISPLEEKESPDMVRESLDIESRINVGHIPGLWGAVAKAHFCKVFMQTTRKGKKYTFIGRRVNTIVAAQMAQYLVTTIWRITREEAKKVDAIRPGAGFKPSGALNSNFVTNFINGAVSRLSQRLAEMETSGANKNALVLYNADEARLNEEYIRNDMGVRLRKGRSHAGANFNSDAYSRGHEAGGKVSLNQQVGASKPKPQVSNTKLLK